MSKSNVVIDNEKYDFDEGITLLEISRKFDHKFPVLVAFMDNEIFSLDTKVVKDCTIRFSLIKSNNINISKAFDKFASNMMDMLSMNNKKIITR